MSAKGSLLSVLKTLAGCLGDEALIDKGPAEYGHNERANMLRRGLAVLIFSAMESFIRDRTAEVLCSFANGRIGFADLPTDLQKACTLGALEGVRFHLKFHDKQDKVTWLISALAPLANASSNISELSRHSFGQAASNLTEDDVRDILRAFGVDSPWSELNKLTARIGIPILDCKSEFIAIKERRHSSAHSIVGSVPSGDLTASVRSVLAICLAFDLFISNALALTNAGEGPNVSGRPKISGTDLRLIFVEPRPQQKNFKFGVRKEQPLPPVGAVRRATLRVFSGSDDATSYGLDYIRRHRGSMVVVGLARVPVSWDTWLG